MECDNPLVTLKLQKLHRELDACSMCPKMQRPVVHGPPVSTKVFLLGQAPGPHEGKAGKPFAWTAGKTMFRWFEASMGMTENEFRARIYMAAVARCFPGKASGGGDRKPDAAEIARCRTFLEREVTTLQPTLVLPVGTLAIGEVLGERAVGQKLNDMVGQSFRVTWHRVEVDVVPLPHPSGASPWHRMEPGKTLLGKALRLVARHPAMGALRNRVSYSALPNDKPHDDSREHRTKNEKQSRHGDEQPERGSPG